VRQSIEGEPSREDALSRVQDTDSDAATDADPATGTDAVLLFVGGPLDGRVEVREARHGGPLPTITHVHLHGGPKVVHRYDLQCSTDSAGVYHLRPRTQRDEAPDTCPD
jgi:hypothetical protein